MMDVEQSSNLESCQSLTLHMLLSTTTSPIYHSILALIKLKIKIAIKRVNMQSVKGENYSSYSKLKFS